MDAVKFLKEGNRLCYTVDCSDCPLHGGSLCLNDIDNGEEEKAVAIVEKWSKEHPIMTNKMKFEEVFGNTCDESGELVLARPSWWCAEYIEPKGEE